jgi:hypothetical protein
MTTDEMSSLNERSSSSQIIEQEPEENNKQGQNKNKKEGLKQVLGISKKINSLHLGLG